MPLGITGKHPVHFAFVVEKHDFDGPFVHDGFVIQGDGIYAFRNVEQFKMEVGDSVQRLAPVGGHGGLALEGAAFDAGGEFDHRGGDFDVFGIVAEDVFEVVGVPGVDPGFGELMCVHWFDLYDLVWFTSVELKGPRLQGLLHVLEL